MVLVISSDETGLLKTFQCSVTISSNTVMHRPATTSHLPPDLTQGRGNGITSLNWIGSDKASIAVGRKGPSVELWKAEEVRKRKTKGLHLEGRSLYHHCHHRLIILHNPNSLARTAGDHKVL